MTPPSASLFPTGRIDVADSRLAADYATRKGLTRVSTHVARDPFGGDDIVAILGFDMSTGAWRVFSTWDDIRLSQVRR